MLWVYVSAIGSAKSIPNMPPKYHIHIVRSILKSSTLGRYSLWMLEERKEEKSIIIIEPTIVVSAEATAYLENVRL